MKFLDYLQNKTFDAGWRRFWIKVCSIEKTDEFLYGDTNFDDGIIRINEEIDDLPSCVETILHEIYHVLMENVGFGEDITTDNENLVKLSSRSLLQAFRLNPELMSAIMVEAAKIQ